MITAISNMRIPKPVLSVLRRTVPPPAKTAIRHMVMAMGIDLYLRTDDRRILETVIFPYFVGNADFSRVLFVGCGWYTRPYNQVFLREQYWTLDIDPARSRYGSSRHIIDSLTNLDSHFGPGDLDLIICTGVFGWGLNAKNDIETAFSKCYECLRDDGVFVLGWADIPEKRPFPPEETKSLRRFKPYIFPSLGASRYLTSGELRHTFLFFRK